MLEYIIVWVSAGDSDNYKFASIGWREQAVDFEINF